MTRDEALAQLHRLAQARAFDRHVGSDRLIQAGLDALLADVDSPSIPVLAGLIRSEENDAPELFDQAIDELGLAFHAPADPVAARWALAYWLAEQIADGSLAPAAGAQLIYTEAAMELRHPGALEPIVHCALMLDDWNEAWTVSRESLEDDALQAAHDLLCNRPPEPQPEPTATETS